MNRCTSKCDSICLNVTIPEHNSQDPGASSGFGEKVTRHAVKCVYD